MEKKVSTAPITKTSTAPVVAEAPMMPKTPTAVAPSAAAPVQTKPMELHEMKSWCKEHTHRYVLVHTKDGWCCDGFVEHIDETHVYIAVPSWGGQPHDPRAFFPFTPFYPYPTLYPYPFFPRRRFYRQVFPLTALLALSLLPYY